MDRMDVGPDIDGHVMFDILCILRILALAFN